MDLFKWHNQYNSSFYYIIFVRYFTNSRYCGRDLKDASAFPEKLFPLYAVRLRKVLMCLTYPMNKMWFSILLGWLAKTLVTKFVGNDGYQKLIPFFLGIVLGSVMMMLFWLGINILTGVTNYNLMPT
jgi:hypothetical protein